VSFPAYGTYNSTVTGQVYYGSSQVIDGQTCPDKIADYFIKNDGVGGTYQDNSTAFNIRNAVSGTWFLLTSDEVHHSGYVTTPCGSDWTYDDAGYNYYWDGNGGYTRSDSGVAYYNLYRQSTTGGSGGYTLCQDKTNYTTYVSDGYYQNGKYDEYIVNGYGSYYSNSNSGNYNSYGTYITGPNDMNQNYYWDGNGGYYTN